MLTQFKFQVEKFYCMLFLFIFMLRWNAVVDSWYECTLPIFVLGDYILLSFSCTVHKPTIFWPNSCISYVLTYILFCFCSPLPYFFSSALLYPLPHFILFPLCSTSLFLVFPPTPIPSPVLPFSSSFVSIPCLHSLCSCFCAWTKCSSDQLAPINRLETMIHDHLTILREPPFVMDDLFISALPRLFSLLVLRCLLFSPSKDGYAPKSVYPLRYVIVSTILLLLIWFWFLVWLVFYFLFHLNSYL